MSKCVCEDRKGKGVTYRTRKSPTWRSFGWCGRFEIACGCASNNLTLECDHIRDRGGYARGGTNSGASGCGGRVAGMRVTKRGMNDLGEQPEHTRCIQEWIHGDTDVHFRVNICRPSQDYETNKKTAKVIEGQLAI